MKNLIVLITILIGWTSFSFAQAPNGFNYQAVARDANNNVYQDQNITLRISLLRDGPSGMVDYSELHEVTTTDLGVFNLQIGNGDNLSGNFNAINWGTHSYFVQIEADPDGGSNYMMMGTSQLLSVPYALYAKESGNDVQTISLNGNQLMLSNGGGSVTLPSGGGTPTLQLSGTTLSIQGGNSVNLSSLQDGVNDADADPNNEIQTISLNGNQIVLSNGGGSIQLPTSSSSSINDLSDGKYDGTSLFLGNGAGASDDGNNHNTALGRNALHSVTSGRFNIGIGNTSLDSLTTGQRNVAIGFAALRANNGNYNTAVGIDAAQKNKGERNTMIGFGAGLNNVDGSHNVFLGIDAGKNELGSNKLYIENSSSTNPLIYGDFDANHVGINGFLGVGTETPERRLHVRTASNTGHIAKFENTSSSSNADGLEIKINRNKTGSGNNFITFTDGDGTAGRIEGFSIASGDGFTSFPNFDFNDYFNPVTLDLDFDPGELDIDFFGLSFDFTPPSLSGDLDLNYNPVNNAMTKFKEVTCWALENGERSMITANPYDLAMMVGTDYLGDLAECKDGGITYGSKGADYAEWLEKEDVTQKMQAGQVVGVKGGSISLNTKDAEQLLVISSMPIILGNQPSEGMNEEDFEKVAFLGQAPVWIIGKVRSGDYIIPSGKNDGYGIAISPNDLSIKHISKIIGRAWSDADGTVNLVNMIIGLKTNEQETILQNFENRVENVEARLDKMEALLNN